MVGKCIRKKDNKVFNYRIFAQGLSMNFQILDRTNEDIGDQTAFELEYEFQNAIAVSIILYYLEYGIILLGGRKHLDLYELIFSDKDFTEETILKGLCDREPEKIQTFCKMDINSVDVNRCEDVTKKLFIRGKEYQGVNFEDLHFMMIGENVDSKGDIYCFVNGKIIQLFTKDGNNSKVFESCFLLINTEEDDEKKKIWKGYEKQCICERFDL
jgi:hypothetical protein